MQAARAGRAASRRPKPFRKMPEREHAADPVNAAFDQGCWRRRPRCSTAAAASFAPIARAPSSPRTRNITKKWKSATAVSSRSAGPGRSSSIAPPKPKCAAPDSSATTRQGIKNTSSPAGNVGERARRRPSQRGFRSGPSAPSTPWLPSGRIVGRSDRPSSIIAPNRNIAKKWKSTAPPARAGRATKCAAPDSPPPPAKG